MCLLDMVFSTYVEVIPSLAKQAQETASILHVCGGDPDLQSTVNNGLAVFSTYVEVIPTLVHSSRGVPGILHVCGGDPTAFQSSF